MTTCFNCHMSLFFGLFYKRYTQLEYASFTINLKNSLSIYKTLVSITDMVPLKGEGGSSIVGVGSHGVCVLGEAG